MTSAFSSIMDSVTRQIKSFKQTPLEKKVSDATSNDNWGVANSTLIELARETQDFNNFSVIMKGIWEGIGDRKEKWRRIYKSLTLLEYCLKYGSERACNEARSEVYKLRPLGDFKHMEEGRDKGSGIREKSKYLVDLLTNHELLKAERVKSTESKEKYSGISSGGAQATPTGYVSSSVVSNSYATRSPERAAPALSPDNTTSKLDEYRARERKKKEEASAPRPSGPVLSNSGKVVVNQSGFTKKAAPGNSGIQSRRDSSSSSSSSDDSPAIKTTNDLIDFDAPVVIAQPKPAICSPGYTAPVHRIPSAQPQETAPYGQAAPAPAPSNLYGQAALAPSNPYAQPAMQTNPYSQPYNPYAPMMTNQTNPYGGMNTVGFMGGQQQPNKDANNPFAALSGL
jgi:epsin